MAELKIAGSGSLTAGTEEYDYVGISGSGKISGNLFCKEMRISGSGKIENDVCCSGDIHISGSGKIFGNVKAASVHASGAASFEKNIDCGSLSVSGAGNVGGGINADNVKISGVLKASNVSAKEEAVISGVAQITGLLNAENVTISLQDSSTIDEIGCTNLLVKARSDKSFNLNIFGISIASGSGKKGMLKANTIEGDNIDIENTFADTVRGARVKIGKGCRIERVEYSQSLEADESSEIKEKVRI